MCILPRALIRPSRRRSAHAVRDSTCRLDYCSSLLVSARQSPATSDAALRDLASWAGPAQCLAQEGTACLPRRAARPVTQSSASRARSSLTAVPFSSPCRFLCALHHEYKACEAPVACISFRLSAAARSKLCLSAPLALLWCECCAPPTTQLQLLQWPKSSAPYRYRCQHQHQHPRVVADTAGWPVTTSPCNLTPRCSPRVSRTSIDCRRRAIRTTHSPRASNSGRV
jgi:hypothetical protein